MTKPNLFIIGAPKCGTTSLANYLNQHPQITLGIQKEPHYFNFDMNNRYVSTIQEYKQVYQAVNSKYALDASVWYYYSRVAIQEILKYNAEAKFIYMVRNPVSLFYSLHQELLNTYEETKQSPDEAWKISFDRMSGKKIPKLTKEKTLLFYPETCALGKRLEHILQFVNLKNLLIIDFKQFSEHTNIAFKTVLKFLTLEEIKVDFIKHNSRQQPKNLTLVKFLKAAGKFKKHLNITVGFNILNSIKQKNLIQHQNIKTNAKLDEEIKTYFEKDVQKLSLLSNQNFSQSWGY